MVCILPIINECKNFERTKSALWVGFFLYMMIRCFVTAFKKEKAESNYVKRNMEANKTFLKERGLGQYVYVTVFEKHTQ